MTTYKILKKVELVSLNGLEGDLLNMGAQCNRYIRKYNSIIDRENNKVILYRGVISNNFPGSLTGTIKLYDKNSNIVFKTDPFCRNKPYIFTFRNVKYYCPKYSIEVFYKPLK